MRTGFRPRTLLGAAVAALVAIVAPGCFTGVESTPRITDSDVRREHAAAPTPEQLFTQGIESEAPSQWRRGKPFRVADNKISLVFTTASSKTGSMLGRDLLFDGFTAVPSLTGEGETEVRFLSPRPGGGFDTLYYRHPVSMAELPETRRMDIPFTVDLDLVNRTDSVMSGRSFYIVTPNWYDPLNDRKATWGYRHVEVVVDSVVEGNANYPLAVCFHLADPDLAATPTGCGEKMVFMTVGLDKTSTRNFQSLFALENPRRKYPQIPDEVWPLIIRSRIRKGMSRDECRLALGAPPTLERIPTRAGMAERWGYSDGVYLIFEDGMLTHFRQ